MAAKTEQAPTRATMAQDDTQPKAEWMKDRVPVRVALMPNDGEPPTITAGVNGVTYAIPRGVNVLLPRAIVHVLRNAIQHTWAMPGRNPLQGLVYLGKHERFYVIELPESERDKCIPLEPVPPVGAEELVELTRLQAQAAMESAAAEQELAKPRPPHPALLE